MSLSGWIRSNKKKRRRVNGRSCTYLFIVLLTLMSLEKGEGDEGGD